MSLSRPTNSTLLFIPTFNEVENVKRICGEILKLEIDLDILFIDDNSPDGTGTLLDELSDKYPNVFVIHRTRKLGIGSAHLEGIGWAYDREYSNLITMDSDFSHCPSRIPDFFLPEGEIVVGSRFMHSGGLENWNIFRKFLTKFGHLLTRTLLGLQYDATGAFRLYRLNKIPRDAFSLVRSRGYSFFFESLYVMHINGITIFEIPISLPARIRGQSKMTLKEIRHSVSILLLIFFRKKVYRDRHILCTSSAKASHTNRGDHENVSGLP